MASTFEHAGARTRIPRPALATRIADALQAGSVILLGDAGFGKTTALQEALLDRDACAWVRCSEASRDPGRLVVDLLAAAEAAIPGAVDVVREQLARPGPPVDPLGTVGRLAAELDRLLVEPLVVVLDDAEHVAGSTDAAAIAGELLDGHTGVRVAVATRRALPLKLAKARAAGTLVEIGVADLAFSAEECAGYLQARRGRAASDAEVESTMAATGGWPLGIALGGDHGGGAAGAVATPEELSAFVDEEVLGRLAPALRARVLATSVPDAFDATVLGALGLESGFVDEAAASGLQLRPVTGAPGWFAYQPLVRESLLDRLRRELPPDEVRDLHASVAPALAAAGRAEEAIEHWLVAERWRDAVAALAALGPELLRTQPQTGHRWLDALPDEVRAAPACRLLDGQLAWAEGAHAEAIELWRSAGAGFAEAGDAAGALVGAVRVDRAPRPRRAVR